MITKEPFGVSYWNRVTALPQNVLKMCLDSRADWWGGRVGHPALWQHRRSPPSESCGAPTSPQCNSACSCSSQWVHAFFPLLQYLVHIRDINIYVHYTSLIQNIDTCPEKVCYQVLSSCFFLLTWALYTVLPIACQIHAPCIMYSIVHYMYVVQHFPWFWIQAQGLQHHTTQAHEVCVAILFQGVPSWQDPTPQPVSLLPQEVMSAVHWFTNAEWSPRNA